jgi:hypothetical protein
MPITITGKINVSKIREIIESGDRNTILDYITKAVDISRVHFISNNIF